MNSSNEFFLDCDTEDLRLDELSRSDLMKLQAVEGWLELGCPKEAVDELEQIEEPLRYHPVVLIKRAHVYAAAGWGEAALIVIRALCEVKPQCLPAWLCQANIMRYVKGLTEARTLLQNISGRFPNDPLINYYLACYHAQLAEYDEAAKHLLEAFERDNSVSLKLRAIDDPDLAPLWKRIIESVEIYQPTGLFKLATLSQYPATAAEEPVVSRD